MPNQINWFFDFIKFFFCEPFRSIKFYLNHHYVLIIVTIQMEQLCSSWFHRNEFAARCSFRKDYFRSKIVEMWKWWKWFNGLKIRCFHLFGNCLIHRPHLTCMDMPILSTRHVAKRTDEIIWNFISFVSCIFFLLF